MEMLEAGKVAVDQRMDSLEPEEAIGRDTICWISHPLVQESWTKTALLCVIVTGFSLGAMFSFDGLVYGLVALAVLAASLSRYWLPTRYVIDEQGVQMTHLGWERRRPWSQFRRVDVHRDGLFLSPFAHSSRLDSFRGCFLRFYARREDVVDFVRERVANGSS